MYLHGCNYPWSAEGGTIYYGLDFGANVWGSHVGVSTRRPSVTRDFAEMAQMGFRVARWFVFCDGRAGIVYDDRGWPEGMDEQLFRDLDAALEIALAHEIGLVLVLLDHRWMFEGLRETLADPVGGGLFEARLPEGRAGVLLHEAGRDALFDRVLLPLVQRYGSSGERADLAPAVAAYELMNEPDFVVEEWERDLSGRVRRPLPFPALADLVRRLSTAVHRDTGARTTMAAARLHNLWAWDDDALGLDLLQVHTYPDLVLPGRDADVFGRHAGTLGVRRPVVLGEFPGNGPAQHPPWASPPPTTLDQYLDFGIQGGFLGAWPWSYQGTDHYGRLPVEPLRAFGLRHPELVNARFSL
jgi:hypothetical protein